MTDPCITCSRHHTTREQIDACIAAGVAMFFRPDDRPRGYEPAIDSDTVLVGGKSRRALKAERRPVPLTVDELGYDAWGNWSPEVAP